MKLVWVRRSHQGEATVGVVGAVDAEECSMDPVGPVLGFGGYLFSRLLVF